MFSVLAETRASKSDHLSRRPMCGGSWGLYRVGGGLDSVDVGRDLVAKCFASSFGGRGWVYRDGLLFTF